MTVAPRILLIDDDPDDRALAAALLRAGLGSAVVDEVEDGIGFAARLAKGGFDAVVTEQRLGWGEGLRLLCTIKDFHPNRPVILLTGDPDPDLASRAVRSGADGFVPKTSRGYLRLSEIVGELLEWPVLPRSGTAERTDEADRSNRSGRADRVDRADQEDRLTRAVAHDLQEPLQLVTRYARRLDERFRDRLEADGGRFLDHLLASATRMQEMIDDLLEYSRLGECDRVVESVDLDEALEAALDNLRGPIEEAGARVTRDPLPTVRADRSQMVRLFQNLLGNAVKFRGDAPPEIHVGARCENGQWLLSVRDNGIGIPARDRERIFGMFQRLHTAAEVPGTGVGLALCRRIAEVHRGGVTVDSEPGAGSTFTVTLPAEVSP
ncbi:MAG: ATP-binding protein [Acidobacteriota bacterium]|jgi:signal transduction histidine kinase